MSYAIVKQEPSRTRQVVYTKPTPAPVTYRSVSRSRPQKIYLQNDEQPVTYVYDDDYSSDNQIVLQNPRVSSNGPYTYATVPRRTNSIEVLNSRNYVDVYDDDEVVQDSGDDVYYLIDGKYYKSRPSPNTFYKKTVNPTENHVYYVDRDSDEEDEPQETVIIQKPKKPAPVVIVEEPPKPRPRAYYQPVAVKPTVVRSSPIKKPVEKVVVSRGRPRNTIRKEIERIELRDKPLPNRNVIYGGTVVYK
jgi:hypothetical protein